MSVPFFSARDVEAAVGAALEEGALTEDVTGPGGHPVTTQAAGSAVLRALRRLARGEPRPEARGEGGT